MDTADIVEINQLMALYGHAFDANDPALIARVFTDDGVFDVSDMGGKRCEGLAAIVAQVAGMAPHQSSRHTGTNVYVYEEGGETRVWSKWFMTLPRDNSTMHGDYRDVVVRTPDGWRIRERVSTLKVPKRG